MLRDVSYQVWRTHMRACVAEYITCGQDMSKIFVVFVAELAPEPQLRDYWTTRPGRKKRTFSFPGFQAIVRSAFLKTSSRFLEKAGLDLEGHALDSSDGTEICSTQARARE